MPTASGSTQASRPGSQISSAQPIAATRAVRRYACGLSTRISGTRLGLSVSASEVARAPIGNAIRPANAAVATAAVRRLVLAAWELDFYGDLGNKEKITEAHNNFAAAFADIKAAYGASR